MKKKGKVGFSLQDIGKLDYLEKNKEICVKRNYKTIVNLYSILHAKRLTVIRLKYFYLGNKKLFKFFY